FNSFGWSPAAAFLQAEDPSNACQELRDAVREAATDPKLAEVSRNLMKTLSHIPDLISLGEAVHVPEIIHSTVMRFSSEPSDSGRLYSRLNTLKDVWGQAGTGAQIQVTSLSLVDEHRPYMHLSAGEGEARIFPLV
ncbi:unnamed protein product, partial [Discosporangium mesarthrocarpum]